MAITTIRKIKSMVAFALKRYKTMILLCVVFFYLGCCITVSLTNIDCAVPISSNSFLKEESKFLKDIEYVVLIISSPGNKEKRDAIRSTWARFSSNILIEKGKKVYRWNHARKLQWNMPKIIKLFFSVGTQGLDEETQQILQNEHSKNDDLLLLNNLEDSYKNLTLKIMNSLQWISNNVKQMKYLIKCDDDSFLRLDLIIRELELYAPNMDVPELSKFVTFKAKSFQYKDLYWGYFDGRAKVYLNGKWQERNWFLCDTYIPYALGGGYVISHNIVDYIGRNKDILSHYNSEDVSMGVWTAALDAVNRVHDIRFDTEWKSRGCDEHMLVRHKQSPSDMFQMYRTLVDSNGEKLCKTHDIKRKPYLYNWNVLPSMCCSNR